MSSKQPTVKRPYSIATLARYAAALRHHDFAPKLLKQQSISVESLDGSEYVQSTIILNSTMDQVYVTAWDFRELFDDVKKDPRVADALERGDAEWMHEAADPKLKIIAAIAALNCVRSMPGFDIFAVHSILRDIPLEKPSDAVYERAHTPWRSALESGGVVDEVVERLIIASLTDPASIAANALIRDPEFDGLVQKFRDIFVPGLDMEEGSRRWFDLITDVNTYDVKYTAGTTRVYGSLLLLGRPGQPLAMVASMSRADVNLDVHPGVDDNMMVEAALNYFGKHFPTWYKNTRRAVREMLRKRDADAKVLTTHVRTSTDAAAQQPGESGGDVPVVNAERTGE